jgi:hypothetical protein
MDASASSITNPTAQQSFGSATVAVGDLLSSSALSKPPYLHWRY